MKNLIWVLLILPFSFAEAQWTKKDKSLLKKMLTEIQFKVTQEEDTEPPFKNEYWDNKKPGLYVDVTTGEPLFSSLDKYDSGTGWPSFTKAIHENSLIIKTDYKIGWPRKEVRSRIGDSHLGHVFDDGPKDRGGKRYCLNSASLKFIPVTEFDKNGLSDYHKFFKK